MASIPSNLARVPNLLSTQVLLSGLTRTSNDLLNTQVQMASGRRINRPSDDSIGASAVGVIDDILERRDQRLRNLQHADSVLSTLDHALRDGTNIVQEARSIGLSQIGSGSDAVTRSNQAQVIDAMLNEMFTIGNRQYQNIFLFAGDRTARAPFESVLQGIRYAGEGDGLQTDLGTVSAVPITLAGVDAFGAMSTRVEGDTDLDPQMTVDTRIVDLFGAQNLGVRLGTINVDVNGTDYEVDLSGVDTVGDVITELTNFFAANEPTVLDVGGITIDSTTGNRFNIDLIAGNTVTFSDESGAFLTAADLGLSQTPFEDGVNETGADVNPKISELTLISSLPGVTYPMGSIRIQNAGQTRDLDLSSVTNVQELMNAVEGLKVGVRVEIAASGDRLNFVNELSGGELSIGEVSGGSTATELGVRSMSVSTRLEDFNSGRGVQIRTGSVDPITGLPDPTRDLDFQVTVKDGRTFDVDLAGAETVQDVLDTINAAALAAGISAAEFQATLVSTGNGLSLTDNTVGTTTSVTALNGSYAAEDLGILGSTTSASLDGEDRATVAVDSVFSHLIALRDALSSNDSRGIEFATQSLQADIDRLSKSRAEVGVRIQRIDRMTQREEDLKIQDTSLRSEVLDLDFAEAATRFANLQTQLQAGLSTTARATSLSLIDFLR